MNERSQQKSGGGKGRRPDQRVAKDEPTGPLIEAKTVVDRGRGSVDVQNGEATTSVDAPWAIAKLTSQAGRGGRVVSTRYELAWAEGGASVPPREFASLAEARAAVGKVIAHPVKATLSKAEATATRGKKK